MSNNQTARELNEACIAACSACPTYREPDEDTEELVHGRLIAVQTLHTKGLQAVRSYWNDRDSIGGSILWDSGYASELDPQQLEVLTTDPRDAEIARLRAEAAASRKRIAAYELLTRSLESRITLYSEKDSARAEAVATLDSERAANATLTAEIEALRKDAERYRWLRNKIENENFVIAQDDNWSLISWSGDDPDRYIDAAMREGGKR